MTVEDFLTVDLPAALTAVLAAVCCALPGNFLVLRRQALLGDAVSHAVLPGIVVGFLAAGALATLPLMLGAMGAAALAAALSEAIRRAGRMEAGAAMGVVFTVMFAAGILLLEQADAADAHLDADHALYGNLESTLWLGVATWDDATSAEALARLPRPLVALAAVALAMALMAAAFFKELKLTVFDPEMAAALGLPARAISAGLTVATALAAVTAFEAVGSLLVVAMFVCPAATARMLTDRLSRQILLSVAAAVLAGTVGYAAAAFGPRLWQSESSLSAAGMIAVVAGALQAAAMIAAPRYGALAGRFRAVSVRLRTGASRRSPR